MELVVERRRSDHLLTAHQVSQWLLQRNYLLTALELLMEAGEAGREVEVEALEALFSDPTLFPPEQMAVYTGQEALDLHATARCREERLAVAEYELRLAREDLEEQQRADRERGKEAEPAAGAHAPSPPGSVGSPGPGQVDPAQRRLLNDIVMQYLVEQGYRVTAGTLRAEAGSGVPPRAGSSPAGSSEAPPPALAACHGAVAELEAARQELAASADALGTLRAQLSTLRAAEAVHEAELAATLAELQRTTAALDFEAGRVRELEERLVEAQDARAVPLLLALARDHPRLEVRSAMASQLFNLIKKPSAEQRAMIIAACEGHARAITPPRVMLELLPTLCAGVDAEAPERRLLVAGALGALATLLPPAALAGTALGLAEHLAEDGDSEVRCAALRALCGLLAAVPVPAAASRLVDVTLALALDPGAEVAAAAQASLVPALARWAADAGPDLLLGMLPPLLERLSAGLARAPFLAGTPEALLVEGTAVLRAPSVTAVWRAMALLQVVLTLLPAVHAAVASTAPDWATGFGQECGEAGQAGLGSNGGGGGGEADGTAQARYHAALAAWAGNPKLHGSWPEADALALALVPAVVEAARRVAPLPETKALRQRLAAVLKAVCLGVGEEFAAAAVEPLVYAAVGLPTWCDGGRVVPAAHIAAAARKLAPSSAPGVAAGRCTLLPLLLAGVLPYCRRDGVAILLRRLTAGGSAAWSLAHLQATAQAVRFASAEALSVQVLRRLVPALMSLAEAPSDTAAKGSSPDDGQDGTRLQPGRRKSPGPMPGVQGAAFAAIVEVMSSFPDDLELGRVVAASGAAAELALLHSMVRLVAGATLRQLEWVLQRVLLLLATIHQRASCGRTQEELAAAARTAFAVLYRVDAARFDPGSRVALHLAAALSALQREADLLDPGQRDVLTAVMADAGVEGAPPLGPMPMPSPRSLGPSSAPDPEGTEALARSLFVPGKVFQDQGWEDMLKD